ncbi:hypothetical protein B4Q04_10945 [Zobellia sp. OII3]|uniref:hypothetical protein n=1 Tax=Zobellia sp. OII3 TaxID=2034520 RepID=UPI000B531617|nr:hypothetical protein [Zobellia sp. OII3]OWW25057.1 hypothetical protein B4Q04_10945 [Zobellia sp. OII3]
MEIFTTFDEQIKGIYLARFVRCPFYNTPETYETELDKIQEEFQDPLFVRNFIKSTASGWKKGDYKNVALSHLAYDVLEETADLFDKLDEVQEEAQSENCFDTLFDNFKGLSEKENYEDPGRRKMYTYDHDSLLRIYGVLLGNNCLIITGAAIKLVGKMQDSTALQLELDKMSYLITWLKDNNITDTTDF